MGLLLSVLVVCVGVLEVLACVRHFQDGYLPLWTPHCAVTSGYAKTHERWRKNPSDNFEFRSTNDVNGSLNLAQDHSSETFLEPSLSVENGYTVKHELEDTRQEVTPLRELNKSDDNLSSFKDEHKIADFQGTDAISSTLGTEESDLNLISTYDKIIDIPIEEYSERKEISTNYLNSKNDVDQTSVSNLGEETSNILSEKYTVADVYNVHHISSNEIPSEILNKSELPKSFEQDIDGTIKLIESNDQSQNTKLSSFQEKIIPQVTPESSHETKTEDSETIFRKQNESFDVSRVPNEKSEFETDLVSRSLERIKPIVDFPLSDVQNKREIPLSPFQEQSIEGNSISKVVENVPESEFERFGTGIREELNTCFQKEIGVLNENEVPNLNNVDEHMPHSRESTPQVYQEYIPLKSDQTVSEIPIVDRTEDTNILSDIKASPVEESSEESFYKNEGNNYSQEEREITPQPDVKKGNATPKFETTLILQEDVSEKQHEIPECPSKPKPEPGILVIEREDAEASKGDEKEDISESCLESETTSTEFVISKNEETDQEPQVTVSESDIPKEINTRQTASPLTIDVSEESSLVTRHPSHQSSMSPPQLPSTPTKKSKADISWPTFFPGTPVIKRPSVSFATPEAVFTNEDQELLRQYAEEATDISPCIKKTEETFHLPDTEERTPSSTDDKSLESLEASERSDSFEEDVVPITFKERSPSNIVAGNDFSRKELQLQKRKSYKQKRYSSATELSTREEEPEDKSFSENKPNIVRASSLKESRRRFRKPAKASSFEDAMLLETSKSKESEPSFGNTDDAFSIPVIEEKEVENQSGRVVSFVGVGKEEKKEGSDHRNKSSERIESNSSKPEYEGRIEKNKSEIDPTKEEKDDEEDSSYSVSEEQSSSQQKSPAKEAFWLIFSGEYTKAMSKDWHSGHFCCWQCDESLTGQRYVLRDDHPYCIKCYETVFANVCEECNKTIGIDSKDLSYKDKHWHEACFLCNKCRVSLVDKQFGSKADKIYCGNCYDAQFASRCDGCGEIFRAGTKKMEYKTRQWHEKCFCCCVCKTAIGTKSFIPREQEIYCATCYEEKFATRCVKCNKIITSGGVTYKNEPWHRECFTCTNCNTSLAGQRFTSRDEKPYCADCFGELFAKRCTACSKPITGIGGTRFISFEDRHWHNDCFICATCKTSLVGRGFITDADDIICPECAKQKLM